MILITFFLSLSGRFPRPPPPGPVHLSVWLYVSLTGVIVYAFLAAYR